MHAVSVALEKRNSIMLTEFISFQYWEYSLFFPLDMAFIYTLFILVDIYLLQSNGKTGVLLLESFKKEI